MQKRDLLKFLHKIFRSYEKQNKIVTEITVCPPTFGVMKNLLKDEIDINTVGKHIDIGVVGFLWTATIKLDFTISGLAITDFDLMYNRFHWENITA